MQGQCLYLELADGQTIEAEVARIAGSDAGLRFLQRLENAEWLKAAA